MAAWSGMLSELSFTNENMPAMIVPRPDLLCNSRMEVNTYSNACFFSSFQNNLGFPLWLFELICYLEGMLKNISVVLFKSSLYSSLGRLCKSVWPSSPFFHSISINIVCAFHSLICHGVCQSKHQHYFWIIVPVL